MASKLNRGARWRRCGDDLSAVCPIAVHALLYLGSVEQGREGYCSAPCQFVALRFLPTPQKPKTVSRQTNCC